MKLWQYIGDGENYLRGRINRISDVSISGEETVKDNVQIFGVRNTIAIVIISNGVDLVGVEGK